MQVWRLIKMAKRKLHPAARGMSEVRQVAYLAARVVELERALSERSAQLRREQARTADLASRVPVDVARARRFLIRADSASKGQQPR